MKTLVLAVLAAAALTASVPSAASAAIMVTTHEGTIDDGIDMAGIFGTAGASLAGLDFTATFTIDTDVNRNNPPIVGADYVASDLLVTPLLSAVFSVNGVNVDISGFPQLFTTSLEGNTFSQVTDPGLLEFSFVIIDNSLPSSLDTPFTLADPGSVNTYIARYLDDENVAWYADLEVTKVTHGAAVPEPSTWALLIAGFGLTGALLRRRKPMPC